MFLKAPKHLQVVSSKQNLAQHYSYSTHLEKQSTTVPYLRTTDLCALLTAPENY